MVLLPCHSEPHGRAHVRDPERHRRNPLHRHRHKRESTPGQPEAGIGLTQGLPKEDTFFSANNRSLPTPVAAEGNAGTASPDGRSPESSSSKKGVFHEKAAGARIRVRAGDFYHRARPGNLRVRTDEARYGE